MSDIAAAFNLWMDEYINDPEAFESTTKGVLSHLAEKAAGQPLSYGERCEVTLEAFIAKIERQ